MGKIRLKNIKLYGYHGCFPEEQKLGQLYEVDVEIEVDFCPAAQTDDLAQTVDYTRIYGIVQEIMVHQKHHLLEAAAVQICKEVLDLVSAGGCQVRIRKPAAPGMGVLDAIEVEYSRKKGNH